MFIVSADNPASSTSVMTWGGVVRFRNWTVVRMG